MDDRAPSMLQPTLVAGVVTGVIVALPGVEILNVCTCCSLVVACGFLAAYLYSGRCKQAGAGFSPGTGATVGLIAGAFYAITFTIMGTILLSVLGDPVTKMLLEWAQQNPDLPPEFGEAIDEGLERLESRSIGLWGTVFELFMSVIVGAVFSTLGGLIGGAAFKVEARPSDSPEAPGGWSGTTPS